MSKEKVVYRYGDKVRVVNPEFFIRCGYPKTIESESDVVYQEKEMRF